MASRLLRNSAPGTQDAAGQTLSESWLDEAGRAAGGNPAISGLIQDAKASVTRGVLEGPAQTAGRLGPRQSRTFTFTFEGNADAAVAVMAPDGVADTGINGPDLDLYVSDDKGSAICISEGPGMPELCQWSPRRTGKFLVRVENRLQTATDFSVLVR